MFWNAKTVCGRLRRTLHSFSKCQMDTPCDIVIHTRVFFFNFFFSFKLSDFVSVSKCNMMNTLCKSNYWTWIVKKAAFAVSPTERVIVIFHVLQHSAGNRVIIYCYYFYYTLRIQNAVDKSTLELDVARRNHYCLFESMRAKKRTWILCMQLEKKNMYAHASVIGKDICAQCHP